MTRSPSKPVERADAPIAAVTFDAGGTLITPWPSVGDIYAEVASIHGEPNLVPAVLEERFARAWQSQPDFNYTRRAWAKLVDATFSGLTKVPPSRSFFGMLYTRFVERDAWRIFPDVLPTLDALSARGLKLGLISNWDRRLLPLLGALKLRVRFEVLVVSCHVHCRKPEPAIFAHAARRFGLGPHQILHVGDSREQDWRGARGAGFQARWLRREGRERGGKEEIGTLGELVDLAICQTDKVH